MTNDGRNTLLLQSSRRSNLFIHYSTGELFAASSNQGKLFRFGRSWSPRVLRVASSRCKADRFLGPASGGEAMAISDCRLVAATVSGRMQPGAKWSAVYREPAGNQIASPRARFIQWRTDITCVNHKFHRPGWKM